MDVLYILGRGSKHDNMELRLSTSDNCNKILEEVKNRFNKKSRLEKC